MDGSNPNESCVCIELPDLAVVLMGAGPPYRLYEKVSETLEVVKSRGKPYEWVSAIYLEIRGGPMFVLVSYDVSTSDPKGPRRLNRVAKAFKDYGQRVQKSVFKCIVDPAQWAVLKQRLIDEINHEMDSLRFYYLGSNWRCRVEHIDAKETIDQEGPLIV